MEKITNFFKEIRTRFSSPIFSSFIISWLIINWKIPIALLFYNMQEINKDGYRSFFDLISKEINFRNGILSPLLLALAYTFIFPGIKNIVLAANSWFNKWGTEWSLNIAKKGTISVERYIALRESYINQTKVVSEVLGSEADFKLKNEELTAENLKIQSELNNWKASYEHLRRFSLLEAYNGDWQITYLEGGSYVTDNATIASGKVNVFDKSGMFTTKCDIKMVCYTSLSGEFIFQIEQNGAIFYQVVRFKDSEHRTLHSYGENVIIRQMRRL